MRFISVWDGSPANDNAGSGDAHATPIDVVVTYATASRASRASGHVLVVVRAEGTVRRPGARGPAVRS